MHSDVQLAVQKLLFQFFDEDSQAHARQTGGLVNVAPGPDGVDLEIQGRAVGFQAVDHHMVLDQGQGAAAAADLDGRPARTTGIIL
jgi:hypothetical protein